MFFFFNIYNKKNKHEIIDMQFLKINFFNKIALEKSLRYSVIIAQVIHFFIHMLVIFSFKFILYYNMFWNLNTKYFKFQLFVYFLKQLWMIKIEDWDTLGLNDFSKFYLLFVFYHMNVPCSFSTNWPTLVSFSQLV